MSTCSIILGFCVETKMSISCYVRQVNYLKYFRKQKLNTCLFEFSFYFYTRLGSNLWQIVKLS